MVTEASIDSEEEYSDEQGESAVAWQELPPERDFFASPYDPPVKALVQEIRDGELIVRSSFQRNQVWDMPRKSKFVESILLNIPIPTLFFAEDDDKSKVVVDGQQRLLSLKEFTENRYSLRGLEVLSGLNGKSFDELTERQQRIINNQTLRCLVISARSDSEIRFQVFERLNQGGVPLNSQEVRHCVFRGQLNNLLHELAEDSAWLKLEKRTEAHPRMLDCELILRFFALRDTLPKYSPPLKTVLNNFSRKSRHLAEPGIQELRDSFRSAVAAVQAVFPENAFRRISRKNGSVKWDTSVNRAVFDAQMLMMEGMDADALSQRRQQVQEAFEKLCLNDGTFSDSVSRATADRARLRYRLEKWAEALMELGFEVKNAVRIPDLLSERAAE